MRAALPVLVPCQTSGPGERGEVDQFHLPLSVGPQRPAAALTAQSRNQSPDVHSQRLSRLVVDAEHLDVAGYHQPLTDARRGRIPQGSSRCSAAALDSAVSGGSLAFSRGPLQPTLRPHSSECEEPTCAASPHRASPTAAEGPAVRSRRSPADRHPQRRIVFAARWRSSAHM